MTKTRANIISTVTSSSHLYEDAKETNKQLMKTRIEASRRFGIYYMELFQSLMEVAKKSVALRVKKNLNMTWHERKEFNKKLDDKVAELILDGAVLTQAQHVDTGGTVGRREIGFGSTCLHSSGGTNCDNLVRKYEELNCKICNHKLDPIYIRRLQEYCAYKVKTKPGGHVMVKRRRNNVVLTSVTSIQHCFNIV